MSPGLQGDVNNTEPGKSDRDAPFPREKTLVVVERAAVARAGVVGEQMVSSRAWSRAVRCSVGGGREVMDDEGLGHWFSPRRAVDGKGKASDCGCRAGIRSIVLAWKVE